MFAPLVAKLASKLAAKKTTKTQPDSRRTGDGGAGQAPAPLGPPRGEPAPDRLALSLETPRSLRTSLAKSEDRLDSKGLEREITLIQGWLKANPSTSESDYLRSELNDLQVEVLQRGKTGPGANRGVSPGAPASSGGTVLDAGTKDDDRPPNAVLPRPRGSTAPAPPVLPASVPSRPGPENLGGGEEARTSQAPETPPSPDPALPPDQPVPAAREVGRGNSPGSVSRASEASARARDEPKPPASSRRSQRSAPGEDSFGDAGFDAVLHDLRNSDFGYRLEAAKRRTEPPLPEDTKRTRARVNAAAHDTVQRHPPPGKVPGAQIQHQTKTLDVTRDLPAGIKPLAERVINENVMWLQNDPDLPATLLLKDPKGGGTRYYVDKDPHGKFTPRGRAGDVGMPGEQLDLFRRSPRKPRPGKPRYEAEHKFMDNYLIPETAKQIAKSRAKAGLPPLDPRAMAIAAGEQARWRMEGKSGSERYGEVIDVAAGATARPAPVQPKNPAQLELPFAEPPAADVKAAPPLDAPAIAGPAPINPEVASAAPQVRGTGEPVPGTPGGEPVRGKGALLGKTFAASPSTPQLETPVVKSAPAPGAGTGRGTGAEPARPPLGKASAVTPPTRPVETPVVESGPAPRAEVRQETGAGPLLGKTLPGSAPARPSETPILKTGPAPDAAGRRGGLPGFDLANKALFYWGVVDTVLTNGLTPETAVSLGKSYAVSAGTEALLGDAAGPIGLLSNLAGDSAQATREQARREALDKVNEEIDERVENYLMSHPGEKRQQVREDRIRAMLAEQQKEEWRDVTDEVNDRVANYIDTHPGADRQQVRADKMRKVVDERRRKATGMTEEQERKAEELGKSLQLLPLVNLPR